jgi:hypothetical protein
MPREGEARYPTLERKRGWRGGLDDAAEDGRQRPASSSQVKLAALFAKRDLVEADARPASLGVRRR